eukprot:1811265-Amphidinium_carterae.1
MEMVHPMVGAASAIVEEKLCAEWAVFYHSYSHAALLYEVHAAVASVLFGFKSELAPLPRILMHEFKDRQAGKPSSHPRIAARCAQVKS